MGHFRLDGAKELSEVSAESVMIRSQGKHGKACDWAILDRRNHMCKGSEARRSWAQVSLTS